MFIKSLNFFEYIKPVKQTAVRNYWIYAHLIVNVRNTDVDNIYMKCMRMEIKKNLFC